MNFHTIEQERLAQDGKLILLKSMHEREVTQDVLAFECGVDRSTISRVAMDMLLGRPDFFLRFDSLEDARKFFGRLKPLIWQDAPIRKEGVNDHSTVAGPRPDSHKDCNGVALKTAHILPVRM